MTPIGSYLGNTSLSNTLSFLQVMNLKIIFLILYRDIATMDKNGYLRLVGRAKELIIRGGENVYPKEIEELLHQHPAVREAFVSKILILRIFACISLVFFVDPNYYLFLWI